MLVQPGLCRTCSETTLLVFPRGGSHIVRILFIPILIVHDLPALNPLYIGTTLEESNASDFSVSFWASPKEINLIATFFYSSCLYALKDNC